MSPPRVSKSAARYLLKQIREYEDEALERIRKSEPGLAPWQQMDRAAGYVLSMLQGCLQFYAKVPS